MSYFLPEGYVERLGAVQDFEGEAKRKDDCQKEVYEEAAALAREMELETIIDIGTGSGWKLVKYLGDRSNVIGVDLEPAVKILLDRYPVDLNGIVWTTPERLPIWTDKGADLVICADMIEHVDDPDATIATIRSLEPKWIVISTPDRALLGPGRQPGPPANQCHVREWNFAEFKAYINQHLDIVRHSHSNRGQCTQCIVARPYR